MANQSRPITEETAPDPARTYERAKPESEGGMGRMDNNAGTPTKSPDSMEKAFGNKQNPENQLNAEDVVDGRAQHQLGGPAKKVNPDGNAVETPVH